MAKNVEIKIEGDKLTLTVDLSKNFGLSASRKSTIIATSEGNHSLPGRPEIKMGLNIYK